MLKRLIFIFCLLFVALSGSQTLAFTHGSTGNLTTSFGAKTLPGYGGVVLPGLAGTLTITSEVNGQSNASTDLAVDATSFKGTILSSQITGCPSVCLLTVGTLGTATTSTPSVGVNISGTSLSPNCVIDYQVGTTQGAGSTWLVAGLGCANTSSETLTLEQDQIVPCNQALLTCTVYGTGSLPAPCTGGSPPTVSYCGPYTLTVTGANATNGQSQTVVLNVNIVPYVSTVKSQWNFPTHGDTAVTSGFQLGKVMSSATATVIALGDEVVMRGTPGAVDLGIQPELNAHPISTTNYDIEPPGSGTCPACTINYAASTGGAYACVPSPSPSLFSRPNAASPCILITSETPNTAMDANNNPVGGGNAEVGELRIHNGLIGKTPDPIDFSYIHFYLNWPFVASSGTPTLQPMKQALWGTTSANLTANGFGVYNNRFEIGPAVGPVEPLLFIITALYCQSCVAYNNHFVGPWFGAMALYNPDLAVDSETVVADVENNICEQIDQSCMAEYQKMQNPILVNNFMFNGAGTTWNPVPGMYFVIGTNVYTFQNGAPTAQGQIPISPSWEQTMFSAACVINGGNTYNGGIPWISSSGTGPGTYSCVSGTDYWSGETPDPNVKVAQWQYYGGEYFLNLQALSVGTAGNSIVVGAGDSNLNTCTSTGTQTAVPSCVLAGTLGTQSTSCCWPVTNYLSQSLVTTLSGGTVSTAATASFLDEEVHSDFFIADGGNGTVGTYNAGTRLYNLGFRGIQTANQGTQQFLFDAATATTCCQYGRVEKGNLSYMTAGNAHTIGNDNNPDIETNTSITDLTGDLYNPSASNYPTYTQNGLTNPWDFTTAPRNINAEGCTGTGGGSFLYNAVNRDAASAASASWVGTITGHTLTLTGYTPAYTGVNLPNVGEFVLGNGMTYQASISSITTAWNGTTGVYVLNTGAAGSTATSGMFGPDGTQCGGATFTPTHQQSIGETFPISPNPVSQAGMLAAQHYSFPHIPNTQIYSQNLTGVPTCPAGAGICNRTAAVWWFTPANTLADNFIATIPSQGSYTITVTSGPIPPQWTPINGPVTGSCTPAGNMVFSVSGSTLTMLFPSTCASSGVTYGTGEFNPDGTVNGSLTPPDVNGAVCEEISGVVYVPTKTCAQMGLIPALTVYHS